MITYNNFCELLNLDSSNNKSLESYLNACKESYDQDSNSMRLDIINLAISEILPLNYEAEDKNEMIESLMSYADNLDKLFRNDITKYLLRTDFFDTLVSEAQLSDPATSLDNIYNDMINNKLKRKENDIIESFDNTISDDDLDIEDIKINIDDIES